VSLGACLAPSLPSSNLPFSDVFLPHCVRLERLPIHCCRKGLHQTSFVISSVSPTTKQYISTATTCRLSSSPCQRPRLQLPSASFFSLQILLAQSRASGVIAHPRFRHPCTRCTRSPIFSLPLNLVSQGGGAEVCGRGRKAARAAREEPASQHGIGQNFSSAVLSVLQSRADGDLKVEMM